MKEITQTERAGGGCPPPPCDSEASRAESETAMLVDKDGYNEMRAVVQALRWAQDPESAMNPIDMVLRRLKGIHGGLEDCLADPHPQLS